jgi:hypothetical protein
MRFDLNKMLLLLAMLCIGGVAQATGYYGNSNYDNYGYNNNSQVVTCQSRDQRTVYCNLDTRYGVRIYRQLSSGACIEGRTWGWDRSGVWVSQGCRAEFAVADNSGYGSGYYGNSRYGYGSGYYGNSGYNNGYYGNNGYNSGYYGNSSRYGYGGSHTFRCESINSGVTYCDVDTRSGVRLVRRLSQAYCAEGSNWGTTRQGVWVSDGCRAEFQVGGYGSYGYGNGYGSNYGYGGNYGGGYGGNSYGYGGYNQRVTCESRDGRYNFCRTGAYIRQAQIYRQLSSSSCQYNYNWGFRSDGVWVDRGCRAEFVVN